MAKSRILSEVLETAEDMHEIGLISDERLLQYKILCFQDDVPCYSPDLIAGLRNKWNLTQKVFANIINTSLSTVQKWEAGAKKPSGPSRKLLHILDTKGLQALL